MFSGTSYVLNARNGVPFTLITTIMSSSVYLKPWRRLLDCDSTQSRVAARTPCELRTAVYSGIPGYAAYDIVVTAAR